MTERELPTGLEDRVVAALRVEGALAASARWSPGLIAVAATVFLVVIAGAFAAGRSMGRAPASGDKYLFLLYGAEAAPADEPARVAEYSAWAKRLDGEGRLDAAERLGPAEEVVGPQLRMAGLAPKPLGFFVVRAASLADATALAEDCPHVKHGGTVVVRRAE